MKRIVLFFILVISFLSLSACKKEVAFNLESPKNIVLKNDFLSWNRVQEADGYFISIDGQLTDHHLKELFYDLRELRLVAGSYQVSVVAVKDGFKSLPSVKLDYLVKEDQEGILNAPQNIELRDGILHWQGEHGANSYLVHVGSMMFNVREPTFDLSLKSIPVGEHQIYVNTLKNNYVSPNSNTLNYLVSSNKEQNNINLVLLKGFDETYETDLNENHFNDEQAYQKYLSIREVVHAYAHLAVILGMSETKASSFFMEIDELAYLNLPLGEQLTKLGVFSKHDFNQHETALFIYEALQLYLTRLKKNNEFELASLNKALSNLELDIETIQNRSQFLDTFIYLQTFADENESETLNALFSLEHKTLLTIAKDIINSLIENNTQIDPKDYEYEKSLDNAHIKNLINVLTRAYSTDDINFLAKMDEILSTLTQLFDLNSILDEKQLRAKEVILDQQRTTNIKLSFSEHKMEALKSLEITIDFLFKIEETTPKNIFSLLDQATSKDELALAEVLLIKDELVSVLKKSLPKASDFAYLTKTLLIMGGSATHMDLSALNEYASKLGRTQYLTFDLLITFISDISKNTIIYGSEILDKAVDEHGVYDFYSHPEVATEFMLFAITRLEIFAFENKLKLGLLANQTPNELLEEIYIKILDMIHVEIISKETITQAEYDFIDAVFEVLKSNFTTYQDVFEIFGDKLESVMLYLVETDGRLIKIISTLDSNQARDLALLNEELNILIDDLRALDSIVFGNRIHENIEAILSAINLSLKSLYETTSQNGDFDLMYADLSTKIKIVITNLLSLKADFFQHASELDLELKLETDNTEDAQIIYAFVLIETLSQTLTLENIDLYLTTINIFYDEILGHSEIVDLIDFSYFKINSKENMVQLLDDIKSLANLNINDLSESEKQDIINFLKFKG